MRDFERGREVTERTQAEGVREIQMRRHGGKRTDGTFGCFGR